MFRAVKDAMVDVGINGIVKGSYLIWLNSHFPGARVKSLRVHPSAQLAQGARIDRDTRVGAGVSVGRHSYVMPYSTVLNAEIGDFCSIGSYVSIGGWEHPYRYPSTSPALYREVLKVPYADTGKHVKLCDDVWVGDGAIILGATVGTGAIIAAGAVVTHDVPPYEIWGGVPARRIKKRFDDAACDLLSEINWTKWSDDEIGERADFFLVREDWTAVLREMPRSSKTEHAE